VSNRIASDHSLIRSSESRLQLRNPTPETIAIPHRSSARETVRPPGNTPLLKFPDCANLKHRLMKPTRDRNTKARPNLLWPGRTTSLPEDYSSDVVRRSNNRRGARGQRNKENSARDRNLGSIDSSGRPITKSRTGKSKRNLRQVQPEVTNPRRAHEVTDFKETSRRELRRRRHLVGKLDQRPRSKRQMRGPALKPRKSKG
jgi:hypothetical protein